MSTDYSLYYVTGPVPEGVDFFESLEEACKGGVTVVQIREKTASTREFLEIAQKAKRITDKYKIPLLINDRLDIALAVGCGLHVGQDDMPAGLARRLLGPDQLLGVSVNTAAEMQEVLDANIVDYVGIGPVYATPTKKDHDTPLGISGVRDLLSVMNKSRIKTVAIGGLNLETVPALLARSPGLINGGKGPHRKLDGVACVSAISMSRDPQKAAQDLAQTVKTANIAPSHAVKKRWTNEAALAYIAAGALHYLRKGDPAVCHNITNQVVMNDTANITLAFSSSPIMSSCPDEVVDLGSIIGALVLNMGTLTDTQIAAATLAGRAANRNGKPVILDPVGVGATAYRRATIAKLIDEVHMSVIKGNAGEIGALAGLSEVQMRGVDSGGKFKDPAAVVANLAAREKTIVAMSGEVDYISDGQTVVAINNGHEYQGKITGSGCMCTAAIACFLTSMKANDAFTATIAGILAYNIAAEIAASRPDVRGPSTFRAALIDECHHLTTNKIEELARVKIVVRQP